MTVCFHKRGVIGAVHHKSLRAATAASTVLNPTTLEAGGKRIVYMSNRYTHASARGIANQHTMGRNETGGNPFFFFLMARLGACHPPKTHQHSGTFPISARELAAGMTYARAARADTHKRARTQRTSKSQP